MLRELSFVLRPALAVGARQSSALPRHEGRNHRQRPIAVFRSALGMTKVDAPALRQRLLQVAASEQAQIGEIDRFGQRYTIDFELWKGTRKVVVRSGWIILSNETVPRLTTCYVRKGKR